MMRERERERERGEATKAPFHGAAAAAEVQGSTLPVGGLA